MDSETQQAPPVFYQDFYSQPSTLIDSDDDEDTVEGWDEVTHENSKNLSVED